jgi:peptidoglycan/xylan/chitin deacetylase (PgdA/CDA1 family)
MPARPEPRALVLTYHAVQRGPAPLCLEPELFRRHVECIAASGAQCLTISQLAAALRAGTLAERALAITFDDGAASVARTAALLLTERGLVGTVFAVAGHLGGRNDWPDEPARSPRLELAGAGELAELAARGWEIGSHGLRHAPLAGMADEAAAWEVTGSREALEREVECPVKSFAYPFGLTGGEALRRRVAETYTAACTTRLEPVRGGEDPLALPRVDAHYVRRPAVLRRVLEGSGWRYLGVRRAGARLRRRVVPDHTGEVG